MYASGSVILHYDGVEWRPLELPRFDRGFLTTWGTSNGDLYAMGSNNIHRYDGAQWHEIQRPAYVTDSWGSEDGHIFVVGGGNNRLYHYDGATWFVDSLITDYRWGDPWGHVSGANNSDVYIAGWGGWLGHFDGDEWTASRPDTMVSFSSIWKAPNGPLYLASFERLFTYDGDRLEPVDLGDEGLWNLRVSGRSANEVYCVSGGGDVFSYDGSSWDHVADLPSNVDVVWGERASNRMFAAGRGVIWELEGSTATPSFGSAEAGFQVFRDLWGSEADGIFLIGTHAYRYLNGAWTNLKKEELNDYPANSIWGRSGRELYAVGDHMILHYDGAQWTWVSGAGNSYLYAVAGTDRDVYAVVADGTILQLHDGLWSPMESGTTYYLYAVYAWGDRAFAGGEDGAMMHYNGREWRPFPSPVSWDIYDMFGFGDRIFAVGADQTEICRFDGKTWKPIFMDYSPGYNGSIWGTSERNLFIGKSDGNVVHFDGSEWSFLPRVTSSGVGSIWGTTSGEIIAVGERNVIRYTR